MSRQHDESTQRPARKPKPGQPVSQPDFISFHPTEAQRREIKELMSSPQENLLFLQSKLESGITFTLTTTKTGDALCLVARERTANFGEGQSLSFFHSDIYRLLAMACWALVNVYADWPEVRVTTWQRDLDW